MSPETRLAAHVGQAERHVRKARQLWDPSSVSGCAECAEELRHAVAEMEAACAAGGEGRATPGTKGRIERLQSDIEMLARLVDSAIAFCRGLEWNAVPQEAARSEMRG